MSFCHSGGILQLDSLMAFGGTISGFTLGDEIDLRGLAFTSGTINASWTQLTSGANGSGTLTVSSGATVVETLTLLGQYSQAEFSATSDGHGGTVITDPRWRQIPHGSDAVGGAPVIGEANRIRVAEKVAPRWWRTSTQLRRRAQPASAAMIRFAGPFRLTQ